MWSTPPYNEKKLNKSYKVSSKLTCRFTFICMYVVCVNLYAPLCILIEQECKNVLLIFSVKESGRFQGIICCKCTETIVVFLGFARLSSESRRDIPIPPWILPASISIDQLGGVFKLDWIHR